MADWDLQYLGAQHIPPNLSAVEIDHFFILRPAELDAVLKSRRTSNRLGLALHIGFLRADSGVIALTVPI